MTRHRALRVLPWWWPPTLLIRQVGSLLLTGVLTGWTRLPAWAFKYGVRCIPGAAGALGMGCIGFPAHPVWEVTTACNLSCVHCHVRAGAGRAGDLSTAEGMRLLEGLAEVAEFRMVAFTGGEPLLRPDLFTLLSHARDLGFSSTIATNATLVDGLTARRLSDAGVVIAAVSLDGADPATHDRIRGVPGAYAAAMAGLQALKEAGILLHVNITVMEYNERALWEVAALADEIGAAILIIYQLVPVGRGAGIREAALDTDRTGHLVTTMAEVQRRSGLVVEPVASPQYWPFLLARAGITRGPLLRLAEFLFHGCAAGRGFVYPEQRNLITTKQRIHKIIFQ